MTDGDLRAALQQRTILVTGGAGFIGSAVCRLLWDATDCRIVNLDKLGYASSPDLRTWVRDDSQAGIDVSDDGWDDEMVSYPHVFEVDGRWYLAYLGNQVGRQGFGLAVLEGRPE